ncbi:Uncharacterised protein [Burkholderia pseudomallei]|nr:Uncharacterised protein [Burkholderia pseudomallei]CAJ7564431.1 Uncharacterised protein [Burkholderia pseudomallei]CAK0347156.1 Uncharacterised protein [Burkholderia pseudomallei]VCH22758.1 Uncharacterised protein [Burkholderia pseudomallei]VCH61593.1 Uncharacterised protein [Burkholderia pseudomallei]
MISTNSPLESLCVFALLFLIGALWGRCSSRDTPQKEPAA